MCLKAISSVIIKFNYNILMRIIFLFLILNFNLIANVFANSTPIINSEWLSKNLCKKNVKLIEVGLSYNSFLVEHVKCSKYTNFYKDGWRRNIDGVAMQLPKPINLAAILNNMGIKNEDHIVLYAKTSTNYYAVAETTAIYFSLKYLGHEKISILDGGYPNFKKKFNLLIEEGEPEEKQITDYKITLNKSILATIDDLQDNKKNNIRLIDARERDFFLGINKLAKFSNYGTIKGAFNIPSKWFLEGRKLKFNKISVLYKVYDYFDINPKDSIIFFCYSGLESSINWFISHELMQNKNSRLYEGSIFEWTFKEKLLYKNF